MTARSVVVVGAGAAGIVAAGFAAQAGAKVQLLERTKDGGRKILISGGGRCNILPSVVDPAQYVTQSSPHIVKQILRSWPLDEQREFFERDLQIPLKLEEESGKLFPVSDKARDVRDGLLSWARAQGVEITFGVTVVGLRPGTSEKRGTREGETRERASWHVVTDLGEILADHVILASGGLSVPATGSDGIGLKVLEVLGHTINPTHPALTPLTLTPHRYEHLAGVSLPVTIRWEGSASSRGRKKAFKTTGGFLVTHRGWSGPTALNVSHLTLSGFSPSPDTSTPKRKGAGGGDLAGSASPPSPPSANRRGGADLFVIWGSLTKADWERELASGTKLVANILKQHLPERLAETLFAESGVPADRTPSQLRKDERERLLTVLCSWPLPYTGDEGYKKAEVTGGGVALGEIVPQTMESRVRPGLFICGEALDVFGPIGGYNFHWAWASGRLAGLGAGAQ